MDITCECAEGLTHPESPCKPDNFGHPLKLVLQHEDGELTVAGENPTVAELTTGIGATGVDRLVVVEEFTNGQWLEEARQERTGADTADGLTDVDAIFMRIEGRVVRLNNEMIESFARLNCQNRVKGWLILSSGHIFGGKTGFRFSNFWPKPINEGYGTKMHIPFALVYQANLNGADLSAQNLDYLKLKNPSVS